MHYPSRIRSSILCMFLLTVVAPNYDHSTLSTRSSATAGESDWEPNSWSLMTTPWDRSVRGCVKEHGSARPWVSSIATVVAGCLNTRCPLTRPQTLPTRPPSSRIRKRFAKSLRRPPIALPIRSPRSPQAAQQPQQVQVPSTPKRLVLPRPLLPRWCVFAC